MKHLLRNPLFLCCFLYVLGMVDCILTIYGLSSHKGYEANPVMAWVLKYGYGAFIYVKMLITGIACTIFYKFHHKTPWGIRMLWVIDAIYLGVAIYQLIGLGII